VIRRELVRCFTPSAKQDAVVAQAKKVKAFWIDSIPDPSEPKAKANDSKVNGNANKNKEKAKKLK